MLTVLADVAICIATIGSESWESREWAGKYSYRWLKAWIGGELSGEVASGLS